MFIVYLLCLLCACNFTHANDSRGSEAFSSVCLSVCPHDYSKTYDPKVFKLGIGNDLVISYTSGAILGSKGQRSKSQGHEVQKGDRVADVSYALCRVPASSFSGFLCQMFFGHPMPRISTYCCS